MFLMPAQAEAFALFIADPTTGRLVGAQIVPSYPPVVASLTPETPVYLCIAQARGVTWEVARTRVLHLVYSQPNLAALYERCLKASPTETP